MEIKQLTHFLAPMQCLVHSRHSATHRYRKNWLFGAREVRVILSQHLSFFLTLFPVTGCWSWLWRLPVSSSHFNSDNSSSEKPFQTLPHHKTAAISFTCCIWVPTSRLCPRPVSGEICLMTPPGHQGKHTGSSWAPVSGLGTCPPL